MHGSGHFFKEPWFLSGESDIRAHSLMLALLIATGLSPNYPKIINLLGRDLNWDPSKVHTLLLVIYLKSLLNYGFPHLYFPCLVVVEEETKEEIRLSVLYNFLYLSFANCIP